MNCCWDGGVVDTDVREIDCAGMQLTTFSHWLPEIFECGTELMCDQKGYSPHLKDGNYSYIYNSRFKVWSTAVFSTG